MALFMTPTKNQLISEAGDIVKTLVFTKIAMHNIDSGYATEISMIAVHVNDITRGMEFGYENIHMPRIMDKLTLCIDFNLPIAAHLAKVYDLNDSELKAGMKKSFDFDAVGLIFGFLERQEAPVCLMSHNGFRMDFPLLKHHLEKLGRSIDTITGSELLCGDSLWTFKMLDYPDHQAGVTMFDMLFYTQQSLHERYVNKPMPSCCSPEEVNLYLIELIQHAGLPFMSNLCCKKFSDVTSFKRNLSVPLTVGNIACSSREARSFVFFDLETTGLKDPKITEVCMIAIHRDSFNVDQPNKLPRVQDKLVFVVEPNEIIDDIAARLTQLSNLNISERNKATFGRNTSLLVAQFLQRQQGPVCLLAHNGEKFDFPILRPYLSVNTSDVFSEVFCSDTLVGLRSLFAQATAGAGDVQKPSFSLQNVYNRCFPQEFGGNFHEAEVDVARLIKIVQAKPDLLQWLDDNKKKFIE